MVPEDNKRMKRILVHELDADHKSYARVVEDMVRNGGMLIPDPNWLVPFKDEEASVDTMQGVAGADKTKGIEFALSGEGYRKQFSKMTNLMPAWIGATADELQCPDTISKYRRFMEHIDLLGLWDVNVTNHQAGMPLRQADLGSIMDLNLLYAYARAPERKVTRVLEVGGGYGRLAEVAFNIFGRSVTYVLVDAVPASLYYSREYLARACPDARIKSFYDDESESLDLDGADIAIVPAWHFEKLNHYSYDVCVNIESMQEMNQDHVDYYLRLFQSVAADEATIYLSNARGYYFRGEFAYPRNWRKLFSSNTPRSWMPDHPTEILRKTSADYSAQNSAVDSAYKYGLWLQKDPSAFISRNGGKKVIAPLVREMASGLGHRWRRLLPDR
jgi:SAM-dependent methyltransferase